VLSDVEELCDRVVVVHEGVVVREGTIGALLDGVPRSYELSAEGVPAPLAARMRAAASSARESGGLLTVRLPGGELGPELAAAAHAAGARVRSLVPERETLESWFVRLTGGGGAPRASGNGPEARATHAAGPAREEAVR
jgi:ABC-type multidrug transport system ATPase subunit